MKPMKQNQLLALSLGLVFLMTSPTMSFAAPKTMKVDAGDAGNKVSFTSDAPVELIHGNTSKITGHITYDDSLKFDAKHPFKVNFDVDLASIDTGIPLRNEHMRDNFLETGKYPKATFKVSQLTSKAMPPLKPGQKVTLTSLGTFSLHGKTLTKKIPVAVTNRGDKLRIQSTFPVRLSDFDIKRPEVVFQKLAETVFVTVDVMAEVQ
jgi:polyisoprenoid-binding protein YceI